MERSYLILGFLVIIIVIVYHLFFSRSAIVKNKISRTKRKKLSDIKNGEMATVSGKIVFLGRVMIAPLSNRKCVYYHVTVKDSSSQKEVFKNHINIDEEKASDVILFDGEHYAIINTKNVTSYIIKDETFYSGFWNVTSDELEAFLVKHGKKPKDYMGWSLDLFAQEGILEEGEKLTVAGKATWRDASEFRFKIPAKKVLYIDSANKQKLHLTDDPYVV